MNVLRLMPPLLALAGLTTLLACSEGGDNDPTGPSSGGTSSVTLAAADVLVAGASVNGATIAPGAGSSTVFTVTLRDPADRTSIRRMQMDYPVHSAMGMMGRQDTAFCHDDGIDGDATAGDGVYSYMDSSTDAHVGIHSMGCPRAAYAYTFHGTDMNGRHTNSVTCTVTIR